MKAKDILAQARHRPFEYPGRAWRYYQEWNDVIFLHWKVDPDLIKPALPRGLKLDVINGKSWVSLVAFDMNNIGIRSIPKIPHISDFHEINIRVYVTRNGKPSVYFLSMEGSKKSSCKVLKAVSRFPYRYSKMERDILSFNSQNSVHNDAFNIKYTIGKDLASKDETDIWLTERYAVFQDHKKSIIEYDVHHLEWPTKELVIEKLVLDYPRFNHLINGAPDRIHYSKGVQVLAWDKRKHGFPV